MIMAKAIVDPEEIRMFAQELKRFNRELEGRMSALHGRLSALGETWKDQEHRKFAEEFEETVRVLHRFVTASDQHIPFLLRKAQRAQDYLDQR